MVYHPKDITSVIPFLFEKPVGDRKIDYKAKEKARKHRKEVKRQKRAA